MSVLEAVIVELPSVTVVPDGRFLSITVADSEPSESGNPIPKFILKDSPSNIVTEASDRTSILIVPVAEFTPSVTV